MAAYFNEIDPYAAQWLRNLIKAGLIPDGEVDERSIVDVRGDDLRGFIQCHFFAGIGGWPYALRLAGWPDDRPAWTGSCPCQPFSLAGKRKGFDDARHLWPVWRELVRERKPAIVFGEQVASATDWLRLVRGDLEAMGYAVGAMPVQAASAGAFHLRDRYWFVADDGGGRCDGSCWRQSEQPRRAETFGTSHHGVAQGDANDTGPQGRGVLPERAGEWPAGASGVVNAESQRRGEGRPEHEFWSGRDAASGSGSEIDMGFPNGTGRETGQSAAAPARYGDSAIATGGDLEWVIGADGKARPVEPGIRLLAHGVPARVAKLRAFGNAIDPRPAAQFIRAVM